MACQKEIDGIINCCSGKPVALGEEIEGFIKKKDILLSWNMGPFLIDHMIHRLYGGTQQR